MLGCLLPIFTSGAGEESGRWLLWKQTQTLTGQPSSEITWERYDEFDTRAQCQAALDALIERLRRPGAELLRSQSARDMVVGYRCYPAKLPVMPTER